MSIFSESKEVVLKGGHGISCSFYSIPPFAFECYKMRGLGNLPGRVRVTGTNPRFDAQSRGRCARGFFCMFRGNCPRC